MGLRVFFTYFLECLFFTLIICDGNARRAFFYVGFYCKKFFKWGIYIKSISLRSFTIRVSRCLFCTSIARHHNTRGATGFIHIHAVLTHFVRIFIVCCADSSVLG